MNKVTHPNSRVVELHRSNNYRVQTLNKSAVDLQETVFMLGSYMNGKRVATGFQEFEINKIMPMIINSEAGEREFREKVETYFHEIRSEIPASVKSKSGKIVGGGLALEIGMEEDNDKPMIYKVDGKIKTQMPLCIEDYIIYRHAQEHPRVGSNERSCLLDPTKYFFILDKANETNIDLSENRVKDEAIKLYLKHKDKQDTVVRTVELISNLGRELESVTKEELQAQFRHLAETKAKRFIEVINDDLLEMIYLVRQGLTYDVLELIGDAVYVSDDNLKLGGSIKEAALYLKDEGNTKDLLRLKELLQGAKK